MKTMCPPGYHHNDFVTTRALGHMPYQGRSQNLKEVPQNYTDVFNIDEVTANDVIQRNRHRKEKN